jgi:hypothetical protein
MRRSVSARRATLAPRAEVARTASDVAVSSVSSTVLIVPAAGDAVSPQAAPRLEEARARSRVASGP